MASPARVPRMPGPRKSILDLAPLELDCMNTLWSLGEGTVREIRQQLAASRPRAYTTIMTIMDRLANKGIVARHKAGRAWVYRPNLSAEEARAHALDQLVEGFFKGSPEALLEQLASAPKAVAGKRPAQLRIAPSARHQRAHRPVSRRVKTSSETSIAAPEAEVAPAPPYIPPRLDESLL